MYLAPGLHQGVPAARYHADDLCEAPTLSSSVAKVLLNKTPRHAFVGHPRLNPDFAPDDDAKFDLGSAAHEIVLGKGGGYEVLSFDNWTTKASKEARAAARHGGRTPLLTEQFDRASAMAVKVLAAVRETPGCELMFDRDHGQAETVGIWQDIGGPLCRLMIDWMGPAQTDIVDLKTTGAGLSDSVLSKTIDNIGYDLSAAFYLRGLHHLLPDLAGRFRYRWVFVEDAEPFEVRVIEADREQIGRGHRKAALAVAKWQGCMATGVWPGYPREITHVSAPGWAEAQWNAREEVDPDFERAVLLDRAPQPDTQPDHMIFGDHRIDFPAEAR